MEGEVALNLVKSTLQTGNNEQQTNQCKQICFKDQQETWGTHDSQNYPGQNHMHSQQYNMYQNKNQGNNWNQQQTQGNNWNHQRIQGNNWNNQVKEEPAATTHKTQNNENHQDQNNGRGFQGTYFIGKKRGHKAEHCWHCPENTHLQPEWWNNTQHSLLIKNNMGNQCQDVGKQINYTQSEPKMKQEQ